MKPIQSQTIRWRLLDQTLVEMGHDKIHLVTAYASLIVVEGLQVTEDGPCIPWMIEQDDFSVPPMTEQEEAHTVPGAAVCAFAASLAHSLVDALQANWSQGGVAAPTVCHQQPISLNIPDIPAHHWCK